MSEHITEICDWRGGVARVDRAAGVIRGVKILGRASRNGRTYLPRALAEAVALYEGAKVNVNHPKRAAHEPRDYQDRLGVIRGVKLRGGQGAGAEGAGEEGLFGDLYFNPKHALAEQLLWDAEHAPENVGLSHNVEARTARHGEQTVVEAILRVTSVDLVADPATTRGLFEGRHVEASPAGGGLGAVASHTASAATANENAREEAPRVISLAEATVSDVRAQRPDLWEAIHASAGQAELETLRHRVVELEEAGRQSQRREAVRRVLAEHGLPDPETADRSAARLVGPRFVALLLECDDEAAMRQLARERAELIRTAREGVEATGQPRSRDQRLAEWGAGPARDAVEFARAIKSG